MQTRIIEGMAGVVNPRSERDMRVRVGRRRIAAQQKAPGLRPGATLMSGTRLELVTSTMSTWRSNQLS